MCGAGRRRSEPTAAPIVSGERCRPRRIAVSPPRRGAADGYVLLGVLIGVTILGIGLSAAVELWSQVLQRDREAELVFRGEATVRAIERFQRDRPGTLPETLEELVEGRYLRRAWRDPMTGEPFRLLRAEDAVRPVPGTAASAPPNPAGPDGPPSAGPTATAGGREAGGDGDEREARGIVGVASTSSELGFRTYQGARRYRDWRFEASVASPTAGNGGERESRPGR